MASCHFLRKVGIAFFPFLFLLLLTACTLSQRPGDPGLLPTLDTAPRAPLTAAPLQGPAPLEVEFVATLSQLPKTLDYYCQDWQWDFGAGEQGVAAIPGCSPFTEGIALQTEYTIQHAYTIPGDFLATFRYGLLILEAVRITVLPPEGPECQSDADCGIGGCSGQLCGLKSQMEGIITTCEYKEVYGCYQKTSCGCLRGMCQWQETEKFLDCKAAAEKPLL